MTKQTIIVVTGALRVKSRSGTILKGILLPELSLAVLLQYCRNIA